MKPWEEAPAAALHPGAHVLFGESRVAVVSGLSHSNGRIVALFRSGEERRYEPTALVWFSARAAS